MDASPSEVEEEVAPAHASVARLAIGLVAGTLIMVGIILLFTGKIRIPIPR